MDEKKIKFDNEKDIIKLTLTLNEENYLFSIYPSKDNITIVFKLEKEKAQTYYYFEKFDLRDFRQANKTFITDNNIQEVFIHLIDITKSYFISLEKKLMKINISFKYGNENKSLIKFILRKKIVSQDRLNPMFVSQIQENKTKIQTLKNQIINLDKLLETKNDVINNINSNITNINNIINNININNSNCSNSTTKNSSSNESNSENNNSNTNDEKDEDILTGEDLYNYYDQKESEGKMSSKKRRKKNRNKLKNIKYSQNEITNKNNNNNESLFCPECMQMFQNKKIIELLIILNVVTILIAIYLVGAIHSLNSNIEYKSISDDSFMNKIALLSMADGSDDQEYDNMEDLFSENINKMNDMQLKKMKYEEEDNDYEQRKERRRKNKERKKKNNK